MLSNPELEILLPVHNEGACIKHVIRQIFEKVSCVTTCQFIICEDGSTDNTKEELTSLSKEIPMKLLMSNQRKGYSQAVKDGMIVQTSPFLLCLDSDGQCDPNDFEKFWQIRDQYDILIGWRTKRSDDFWRVAFSRIFHRFYTLILGVPVHDPSCPYILTKRNVIQKIAPKMKEMQQGFWWEFTARTYRMGYTLHEIPIHHRAREAGKTQVYKIKKIPGIGFRHFMALFAIYNQTKQNGKNELE
jgi:glycosyltransferase involved in cell wall biosynthesis